MFRLSLALATVFMLVASGVASARDETASAKSRTTHARSAVKDGRTQRRVGYRAETVAPQKSCGEFKYWKDGKCNDARNKSTK